MVKRPAVPAGPKDEAASTPSRRPERPAVRETRRANAQSNGHGLDELDLGIIRLLQKNGRMSNTEISRLLNVTETTVRNRIARLLEEELIAITAVVQPQAVGVTSSAILGLSVNLQQIHSTAATLTHLQETRYVGISTGRYDLLVEVVCSDQEHLLQFIVHTLGEMPGIKAVETSLILEVSKRSFLII
jgi:Lrp/AsnC family transcriptional regulator for asnA, asnC and gidA